MTANAITPLGISCLFLLMITLLSGCSDGQAEPYLDSNDVVNIAEQCTGDSVVIEGLGGPNHYFGRLTIHAAISKGEFIATFFPEFQNRVKEAYENAKLVGDVPDGMFLSVDSGSDEPSFIAVQVQENLDSKITVVLSYSNL